MKPKLRHGVLRRATRAVAKAEGVKVGRIRFRPYVAHPPNAEAQAILKEIVKLLGLPPGHEKTEMPLAAYGSFNSAARSIQVSTKLANTYDPGHRRSASPASVLGHELSHAKLHDLNPPKNRAEAVAQEKSPEHKALWNKYQRAIQRHATELAKKDKSYKTAASGDEVAVSTYERASGPVSAYTRRKGK